MTPSSREINEYSHITDLFVHLAALPADVPDHVRLRTESIEAGLPLADHIARRYRGRGQSHEDLVQVACVGLVNAVNRFDLAKGQDFLSFAVPTMIGEVRKHFRDRGVRSTGSTTTKHPAPHCWRYLNENGQLSPPRGSDLCQLPCSAARSASTARVRATLAARVFRRLSSNRKS